MATAQIQIENAVMATLQADTLLSGGAPNVYRGLAAHPENASLKAILLGSILDIASPVYDCLTFSVEDYRPVKAFEDAVAGAPVSPVDMVTVGFHAFSNQPDGAVPMILGAVDTNFRNQAVSISGGAAVGGGNATCFRASLLSSSPSNFDQTLRAWWGYVRYLFRLQR